MDSGGTCKALLLFLGEYQGWGYQRNFLHHRCQQYRGSDSIDLRCLPQTSFCIIAPKSVLGLTLSAEDAN